MDSASLNILFAADFTDLTDKKIPMAKIRFANQKVRIIFNFILKILEIRGKKHCQRQFRFL